MAADGVEDEARGHDDHGGVRGKEAVADLERGDVAGARCAASMSEPPVVAWPRRTRPKPAPHSTPPKTAESSTSSVTAGTGR